MLEDRVTAVDWLQYYYNDYNLLLNCFLEEDGEEEGVFKRCWFISQRKTYPQSLPLQHPFLYTHRGKERERKRLVINFQEEVEDRL